MLALLPFLALALLVPICRRSADTWRAAVLAASVLWGIALTLMTEGLSLFRQLTVPSLIGLWGMACLGLAVLNLMGGRRLREQDPVGWQNLTPLLKLLLLCVGVITVTSGIIAFIAPPNNWDSMAYHMTRVEHWIQNRSVAHYPTHVLRELHRNPWAEFGILHLQVLSGNDRFANLVQWLSMVGSLVGVSLIARELGADVRGQVFAVVVAATIPLGILQASSTQTDYAGSYWVVCLVYFLLTLMKRPGHERIGVGPSLLAGGSLGLALLTKATAYVHGFPFLLWYGLSGGWSRARRVLPSLVILLLVAGGLNVGYYGRNLQLFGSLFGPGGAEECDQCKLTNDAVTLPLFLSNVMRHTGSHLRTPSQELNNAVTYLIGEGHRLIGADIADARSTWRQMSFFLLPPEFDENADGNPVHLLLILWTLGLILVKRERFSVLARRYAHVLFAAFLLYCLVIKWAPPNIRYQLGLFILWAPVTGIALAKCRRPATPLLVALALVLLSVPWLVLNRYRPLIGEENILHTPRESQLFIHSGEQGLRGSFEGAAQFLSQHRCWRVGIIRGQDDMAYPLWVLLRGTAPGSVQIEEVQVSNVSSTAPVPATQRGFEPCATVTINGERITATVKLPVGHVPGGLIEGAGSGG